MREACYGQPGPGRWEWEQTLGPLSFGTGTGVSTLLSVTAWLPSVRVGPRLPAAWGPRVLLRVRGGADVATVGGGPGGARKSASFRGPGGTPSSFVGVLLVAGWGTSRGAAF